MGCLMAALIVRLMMDDSIYIEDDRTSQVGDMVKVRILQGFTEDLVGELVR